jgi:lipoprotein NlpD
MNSKFGRFALGVIFGPFSGACLLAIVLASCRTLTPAPVVDRTVPPPPTVAPVPAPAPAARAPGDTRPEFHDVLKGETLYSIALEYGLAYRDLAQWNGLDNPNVLQTGQRLRLTPPGAESAPVPGDSGVVVTPLGQSDTSKSVEIAKPTPLPTPVDKTETAIPPAAVGGPLKTEPKAVKLPYSEKALAQMQNVPGDSGSKTETKAAEQTTILAPPPAAAGDEDRIDWAWPTRGKVKTAFSATSKGVDIPGQSGQPVFAAAAGKVIHVGANLRGYGKLVIIQHSSMFLSAYAHNSKILVKEGDRVSKGQKIAEMGNTDADQVKLHFEIRRFGKPVDPTKYLPGDNAS